MIIDNFGLMHVKLFQVDAFADRIFSGNPAGVCPLESWLPDDVLQNIAMENNLAETAFYVKKDDQYELRWFTPSVEVDLCGHATLAAAFVLFNFENHEGDQIIFYSPRSGKLTVTKEGDELTLDFPTDTYEKTFLSPELLSCFNFKPVEAFRGKTDYMLVFDDEAQIRNAQPDLNAISKLNVRGVIITAKGQQCDFVSRFFAPQSGINEDPVTGSAHTTLTPYWAERTGRTEFTAIQLSPRQGRLRCIYCGERVKISGKAKLYLKGEIFSLP